jgi:hypothetical protein
VSYVVKRVDLLRVVAMLTGEWLMVVFVLLGLQVKLNLSVTCVLRDLRVVTLILIVTVGLIGLPIVLVLLILEVV